MSLSTPSFLCTVSNRLFIRRVCTSSTPLIGLYCVYRVTSGTRRINCLPNAESTDPVSEPAATASTSLFPSFTPAFLFIHGSQSSPADSAIDSDDEDEQSSIQVLSQYLYQASGYLVEFIKLLTRWTVHSLPESVRSHMSNDEQSMIAIGVGCVGGLCGMAIRNRLNGIVLVGSMIFFGAKVRHYTFLNMLTC
jgi:hypothetical protein